MFLFNSSKLSNKVFFIDTFRSIFFNYSFLMFFNILNRSSLEILKIKALKFKYNLKSIIINASVIKTLIKKNNKVSMFSGNYLVMFSDDFNDMLLLIKDASYKFSSFIPFALLFKGLFMPLNSSIWGNILVFNTKTNNITLYCKLVIGYTVTIYNILNINFSNNLYFEKY